MNQKCKKKCQKGGQHENRDIEAVCVQQQCKSDRLLCFYCIHESHERHQIVYLLQGLDSPLERLGVNSKIEKREEQEKYIKKKIKKINHGWKNLYRIFANYINKIQQNLQPQIQAILDSFDQNSASKFAQVITSTHTSQQTVQQYVQKIKLILKYDLSDVNQLKVSTGVAYEDLKQSYAAADKEIRTVMEKIVKEANLFSVLNCNLTGAGLKRQSRLGIDDRNRVSIWIEKDRLTVNSYESRFEGPKGLQRRVENRWLQRRSQLVEENKYKVQRGLKSQQKVQICGKVGGSIDGEESNVEQQLNDMSEQKSPQDSQKQKEMVEVRLNLTSANQVANLMGILNQEQKKEKMCQLLPGSDQPLSKRELPSYHQQIGIEAPNQGACNTHGVNQQQRQNLNQPQAQPFQPVTLQEIQNDQIILQILEINKIIKQPQLKTYQSPHLPISKQEHLPNHPKQQHLPSHPKQQHPQLQPLQSEDECSQDSSLIRYQNYHYSDSQNSHSPPIINLKQIYLSAHSLKEILHYLEKVPPETYLHIRSLEIICDTLPLAINDAIINLVLNFKSLKKLVICQASGMKPQHIAHIATHLTDLQHLVLQQNYAIKDDLADLIYKKLKRLKKFHYTSDPLEHLLFKEQNTDFMVEVDGNTKFNTFAKLTDLPQLETIAVENIIRTNEIKTHLAKLKKISELSILYHSKEHKINPIIEMLSKAESAKSLICLELKQCYFREEALIEVLENCRTLRSLSLNKCRDVTNKTISALKRHKGTLKQLDLMEQDEVTGHGFEELVQLEILSLKACWQVQQQVLGRNISGLTRLKALNLNFNRYWVTENIFEYISKVKTLELLEIDNNKINYNGLFKITPLTHLNTLACGNTQLTGDDIVKFLSLLSSKIHKLSLKRQVFGEKSSKKEISNRPFEGAMLKQVSKYAPGVTHLNIKGMKGVLNGHLQPFENLKCICVDTGQLDEETLNWLKQQKVSIYIGYTHLDYDMDEKPREKLQIQKEQMRVKLEE